MVAISLPSPRHAPNRNGLTEDIPPPPGRQPTANEVTLALIDTYLAVADDSPASPAPPDSQSTYD